MKLFTVNTDGTFIVRAQNEDEAFRLVLAHLTKDDFDMYESCEDELSAQDRANLAGNAACTRSFS